MLICCVISRPVTDPFYEANLDRGTGKSEFEFTFDDKLIEKVPKIVPESSYFPFWVYILPEISHGACSKSRSPRRVCWLTWLSLVASAMETGEGASRLKSKSQSAEGIEAAFTIGVDSEKLSKSKSFSRGLGSVRLSTVRSGSGSGHSGQNLNLNLEVWSSKSQTLTWTSRFRFSRFSSSSNLSSVIKNQNCV